MRVKAGKQPKGKSTSVRVRRATYRDIAAIADEMFVPIATAIEIMAEGWQCLDDQARRDAWRAVRERRTGNGADEHTSTDHGAKP